MVQDLIPVWSNVEAARNVGTSFFTQNALDSELVATTLENFPFEIPLVGASDKIGAFAYICK